MIGAVDDDEFLPDSPARRLPWILALALLLVLAGLIGFGRLLRLSSVVHPARLKPLQAQIYELPASRGAVAGHHDAAPAARPVHPVAPAPKERAKAPPMPKAKPTPGGLRPTPHAARHAKTARARPVPKPPLHRLEPAPVPRPHRAIDWSSMQSQISAAVGQGDADQSALPQTHDPHTLVARYYLASLLSKLQRVGNMNYPTHLMGVPVVDIKVASDGSLMRLKLLRSSGSDTLDQDALAIVREAAPFAPFPDKLMRRTPTIELVCYMRFEGYRHINPIY